MKKMVVLFIYVITFPICSRYVRPLRKNGRLVRNPKDWYKMNLYSFFSRYYSNYACNRIILLLYYYVLSLFIVGNK